MMKPADYLTPADSVDDVTPRFGDEWPGVVVRSVDVARSIPAISAWDDNGRRIETARVLVRVFDEPLGIAEVRVGGDGASRAAVASVLDRRFGDQIRSRFVQAAVDSAEFAAGLPLDGVRPSTKPAYLEARQRLLVDPPRVTVAVCTRDRPESLRLCLTSLLGLDYPRVDLLVVDNAPSDSTSRDVVTDVDSGHRIRYVVEARPGVSWARNRAIAEAGNDFIAYVDDDEVVDPHWLTEVVRAFTEVPGVDAVSGPMVAAELVTRAQVWFEMYGGHNKGKTNERRVYDPANGMEQSPYYPLPPFGTGGNMAFRRAALVGIGGFDTALGAGSPAAGAEDTLVFSRILAAGGSMVYQPTAVVWHYHRRTYDALRRQLQGYGSGLTGYYVALALENPRTLFELVRLLPRAWHDFRHPEGLRSGSLSADFPEDLMSANRRGLASGPWLYLRGRWALRRAPQSGFKP